MGFAIDRLASEADMASVAGKRAFTGRVLAIIKAIPDPLERNFYVQQLAQRVNIESGVLAEALQREPVRRPVQRAVPTGPGPTTTALSDGGPSGLELEALGMLLRYPGLATEVAGNGALPFRDATAAALVRAWQDRVAATDGIPNSADLEGFLGGTRSRVRRPGPGPATRLAAGGEDTALDLDAARGVLRVTLLRLREARLEEYLRDGRLCWRRRSATGIGSGWQPLSNRSSSSVARRPR